MKIAYLITAFDQAPHFADLIHTLDSKNAEFFVHIDRRADIQPFKNSLAKLKLLSPVKFLEGKERLQSNWSSPNFTKSVLYLLKTAHQSNHHFQRFVLLSGSDFPIKRRETLEEELLSSETEYMRIDYQIDLSKDDIFANRLKYYYFYNIPLLNPRMTPSYKYLLKFYEFMRRFPRTEKPLIPLYQGSTWWALTGVLIRHILDYLDENPACFKYFRFSDCPDEILFQSLVAASPYRKNLSHDFQNIEHTIKNFDLIDHGSHFIDWTTPNIILPKTLNIDDLDRLRSSKAFFARKFNLLDSAELLEAIKQEFFL